MRVKIFEVVADNTLGGAPKHVLTLVKGLDKRKFDPIVICPEGWLSGKCKELGIETKTIKMGGFLDLNSISKLKKLIRAARPEIIHLHGTRAGWLGAWASIKSGSKVIYTEHLFTLNYHLKSRSREILQIFGIFFINLFTNLVLAPSGAVKKFLIEKVWVKPSKVKIIPNGLEDLTVKREDSEDLKIGFIGSLNVQKGVPELIKAMKDLSLEFPDLKLEIVGDGPLKNTLEKQSEPLKKQIKFLGSKDDIKAFLANWKMIVIPSVSESFGQVAVEAGIASLPVVATAVGGLPEVVVDDGTGILVKPADNEDLVKAISYLLHNPKEANRMGENGRKIYERFFTAEKMVENIEKSYIDLIEGKHGIKEN